MCGRGMGRKKGERDIAPKKVCVGEKGGRTTTNSAGWLDWLDWTWTAPFSKGHGEGGPSLATGQQQQRKCSRALGGIGDFISGLPRGKKHGSPFALSVCAYCCPRSPMVLVLLFFYWSIFFRFLFSCFSSDPIPKSLDTVMGE